MEILWLVIGLLTLLNNIVPTLIFNCVRSMCHSFHNLLSPNDYFEIPEFTGYRGADDDNHLYRHVTLYLNSTGATASCRLTLSRSNSSESISISVADNHTIYDSFGGHRVTWTHNVSTAEEKRSFTLKIRKYDRKVLLETYLKHVTALARDRRLYMNIGGHGKYEARWASVPFHHRSTFGRLALEPELKKQLVDDLESFSKGKEFYRRTCRAWKRGYLLQGPPGSGKSTVIAAMANFLCYDVYVLDLSITADISELRALLIQTTNRSIIVIEDIERFIDLTGDDHSGRVKFSGILNFNDGLWSCCVEERLNVFTTTKHCRTIDPALLRCGGVDVHVRLDTCGMDAVKTLVKNYLDLELESHRLFGLVERCVSSGGGLTPALIGEILWRNRSDVNVAMQALVSAMEAKISGIMDGQIYEDHVKTPERVVEGSFSGSPVSEEGDEKKKKKIDCVSFGYEHKVEVEEEN